MAIPKATRDKANSLWIAPDQERRAQIRKNRELFYLIYHAVGETSQQPLIFNAQYGLFRGLLTMFALLALVSFAGLVWACLKRPSQMLPFGLWSVVFSLSALIAYFRCKKRSEDFAQSVYDLFMVSATSKTEKSTPL